MAINKKGKRKLIFRDQIYYWYVAQDKDSLDYLLTIFSDDCSLYLSYRTNQISDYFIHPKISVLKSDALSRGIYVFFPPLGDEVISKHNVCAILNWYYSQPKDSKPLKLEPSYHPFENIDFGKGKIEYIESDLSNGNLKEDLLQVSFPNHYILDVGYYRVSNAFIVYVIHNGDWDNPLFKVYRGWYSLRETIINAVEWIDRQ